VDLIAKTNCVISSISNWYLFPNAGLQFSSDGRFLANTTMTNSSFAARSVYLYDFQTGSNLLVSRSFNSIGAPNNASDSPGISADGRYVAYRSFASNCVPGDFNEVPDLFLYDRLTGATTLLSVNQSGTLTANNRSSMPVFSADCRTLLFQSWASDLSGNDFNNGSDLYALDLTALPVTSSNGGPTNSASVFYAQLLPAGSAAQNPTISWPLAPGVTYQVQYKNNLNDPAWQNLPGNITFIGDTGYGTDLAPAAGQRFYRIVLVND
jgi:Tol biopolymer transport system component